MSMTIRPAQELDIPSITALVNQFAAQDVMLPRTEASVHRTMDDWLVVVDGPHVAACGSLVPLTGTLVEIRSLAVDEAYQGQGLGGQLVLALVELARAREYEQVCALTLRENFFVRLGFELVDRWSISPKVWQACIYCPKFHRCDEVAVLMNLVDQPARPEKETARPAAWNSLLRWNEWQPLKLAYQHKPGNQEEN
jgi:amino-acid N-acetyltransferase